MHKQTVPESAGRFARATGAAEAKKRISRQLRLSQHQGWGLALSHLGVWGWLRDPLRSLGWQRHSFLVGRQDHLGGTEMRGKHWPEGTTPLAKGWR